MRESVISALNIAREDWREFTGWVILSFLLVFIVVLLSIFSNDPNFSENILSEIFGIGATVFLVNRFAEWSRFRTLLRQLNASSNDVALNALDELKARNVLGGKRGRLQGMILRDVRLSGANLTRVNLTQTDLTKSKLRAAMFRRTDNDEEETQAIINKTNFAGADLTEAEFNGVEIIEADFTDAILTGVLLEHRVEYGQLTEGTEPRACIKSANFQSAILTRAKGRYLEITGETLFRDATLHDANFTGSNFNGSDLSNAKCLRAAFEDARFREVLAEGIDLTDANLSNAKFARGNLKKAILIGTKLDGTVFEQVQMSDAQFRNATLDHVRFADVNLSNARFRNVMFLDVVFSGNTRLKNVQFDQCTFDNVTLPDGAKSSNVIDIQRFEAELITAPYEEISDTDQTPDTLRGKSSPF